MLGNLYLERYAYPKELINAPPHPNLGLVVVVPCYNEPDLITSLESLYRCQPTSCTAEIIVVINQSESCTQEVAAQNLSSFNQAKQWTKIHSNEQRKFHILLESQLPDKHAGVGLARKIGMDEAVRRFEMVGRHEQGVIICFDADCTCQLNYLNAVEDHFKSDSKTTAATVYFEHPLTGPLTPAIYDGICHYELFLRYYRQGLKYIGYPYAYFTVGSCLAVKSLDYQKQGGMNRRKAGEDFYFIEEHCRMGTITEITTTTVFPSPRVSERVPFGTGKRQSEWLSLDKTQYATFDPEIFRLLGLFLAEIRRYFEMSLSEVQVRIKSFPPLLRSYLEGIGAAEKIDQCRQQTTHHSSFKKCFYQWFNGLRILQFLHHCQAKYKDISLENAAPWILKELHGIHMDDRSVTDLLKTYRKLDKQSDQIQ